MNIYFCAFVFGGIVGAVLATYWYLTREEPIDMEEIKSGERRQRK